MTEERRFAIKLGIVLAIFLVAQTLTMNTEFGKAGGHMLITFGALGGLMLLALWEFGRKWNDDD